ncbi:MAG: alpha/beta hydrolase [Pseudomonadota bacterium]
MQQQSIRFIGLAGFVIAFTCGEAFAVPPPTSMCKVGRGRPLATVIFLHGLGGGPGGITNERVIRAFSRHGGAFRIVSPGLRPVEMRGEEILDRGPHTMSDQLQRIRHIIDRTEGKIIPVGHSFGGKATNKLAREYPDRIPCVVQINPSVNMLYSYWKRLTGERGVPADRQTVSRRLEQHETWLRDQREVARSARQSDRVDLFDGELGFLTTMRDLLNFNETAQETGIHKPTLVLKGTADDAASVHYARRYAQDPENTGITMIEFEGLDHHLLAYKTLPDGEIVMDQRRADRDTEKMTNAIVRFVRQHLR